ncbi:alpha amylase C-terminal domain-containing protein [Myxococcus sp. XM-1-1-1]|uniref:alpha-amylase family glycosyl hydrolase n=1 Tax=Myxococcus sp. XM-1-1-1 TaxID=2874602 RepID=UPI001CBAA814|nr:alpha-amylase family glycosyl hydrolase [Myxococcus sp. XM-1-1-1]MBZ4408776.1 alpha amylase C-terminal domain-containing protein [Myxococcus sp. XM-1-1-1]
MSTREAKSNEVRQPRKDFSETACRARGNEVSRRTARSRSAPELFGPAEQLQVPGELTAFVPMEAQPEPSWRPGMGVIPYDGGATFRVWAPHAQRVQVVGDFSHWHAVELAREPSGNFSRDIQGAYNGQQYQYIVQGRYGDWRWRNDPRAADVTHSTGNSVILDHRDFVWRYDGHFQMPARHEAVIYELHIGTFHDSPGWGPGHWLSAIDKLDYLRDLGVNLVELMPSAEFAGDFSWGYNPTFPFAPESTYGAPNDLKRFVDEAHRRGIGVIMDVVYNHLGPSDLPHWDFDGETFGRGGVYFYADWRASTPWGDTRPDYGRHEVRDYLRDNALMWLREYHMDGLRVDATKEIRTTSGVDNPAGWDLLRSITEAVKREFPWKLLIAEDMAADPAVTHPQGAGFDAQWDAAFVHPVRAALTAPFDEWRDLSAVRDALYFRYNGQSMQRVIFTESHDEVANGRSRLPTEVSPYNPGDVLAKKKALLGAALTLTAPGIPMLFMGQEFLEDGHFDDGDPLDWNKSDWFGGILQAHRDLIRLRRNWHDTSAGLRGEGVNVFHLNHDDKVLAFHRWQHGGAGDDVVVIVNLGHRTFSGYELGLPSDGLWRVRFNSDWQGYSPDFGGTHVHDFWSTWGARDGMPARGAVSLGAYSAVILSRDRW